jgi:hypothetical protein
LTVEETRSGITPMKQQRILLLVAIFVFPASQATSLPASIRVIEASRLLDPRTGKVLSPATVIELVRQSL